MLEEPAVLPDDDSFDVDPIFRTTCERLKDDEILGAACPQGNIFGDEKG